MLPVKITRGQFVSMSSSGDDRFAATFRAKADAMGLWEYTVGFLDGDKVMSAICVKQTRREPVVANLQLLHTFAVYRRQGLARRLVLSEYGRLPIRACLGVGVEFFRVSSEPDAVAFYRSLGLKFWGYQKSGSLLCLHRICDKDPANGDYKLTKFIEGALSSGRRGALVERFKEPC
jgi:hypothetical protein